VAALKGKISQQHIGGFNTRRGLIIMQFAISQVLITGMVVVAVQMRYAKDSDLGFNKDAIVMVPMGQDSTGTPIKTFKTSVAAIPGVQAVSACYAAPSSKGDWGTNCRYNNDAEDEPFNLSMKAADDQYVSTFGLELVAGRNIFPSDTLREFVVNETFVHKLGIKNPQNVIGKTLSANAGHMTARIVGVMKDFHDKSFHSEINAVCIYANRDNYSLFAVKIDMKNASQTLAAIGKTWDNIYPNQVYDYKFLDDQIAEFYATEQTMLTLVQAFTFVAIFIGCLGLYGLVMFMTVQKTKEIGIRKVLGSTLAQILWIFGREFSRLIVVAFVIATPVAWWLMNSWLQDFKFHIQISPLFFAATILLMFVIAALTVGYQAMRAALMNPVRSLKAE
jgi:ABC-type antimicrobial peptide transport system permease subunit